MKAIMGCRWLVRFPVAGCRAVIRNLAVLILGITTSCVSIRDASAQQISLHQSGNRVEVQVGDQPFTVVRTGEYSKPVLYPIMAPGQIPTTRGWPIEDLPGEAHDHPHHKSLWFAHGDVNGADFWADKARIQTKVVKLDEANNSCQMENSWLHNQIEIATDRTELRFGVGDNCRWIDWDITITAIADPLTFGDTKEGTFAIRTRPELQLTPAPEQGVHEVFGQALNSSGQHGKAIWGQRAEWVYYFGPVDNQPIGIMLMDHPKNLRHPTTWHARDYGLIAANPFGLHDFLGEPAGSGNYELRAGQTLRLVYRVLFHAGTSDEALRKGWYADFKETDFQWR